MAGAAVLWTSYTEVWAAAERMARVLHLGCAGAGVVAIWAPNGRAWVVGDLACVLAGLPSALGLGLGLKLGLGLGLGLGAGLERAQAE